MRLCLRETTAIAASAADVWPFLADPVLHADWNPKVISIGRERSGPVRIGEQFEMIYRMSGRDRQSHVEVTIVEPERRVTFRHRMIWKSTERIAEESYEISPDRNGVKVVQTINLTRAGIPWPFRLLIWFIHRFGWQTGEPDDQPLKRLVEQSVAKG